MTTINTCLCASRHPMPVEDAIFPMEISNPMDFSSMGKMFLAWYREHDGEFVTTYGSPLNGTDYSDVPVMVGTVGINLYVTGLTPALTTVIRCCMVNGISLTLMHFNRATGEYEAQVMC